MPDTGLSGLIAVDKGTRPQGHQTLLLRGQGAGFQSCRLQSPRFSTGPPASPGMLQPGSLGPWAGSPRGLPESLQGMRLFQLVLQPGALLAFGDIPQPVLSGIQTDIHTHVCVQRCVHTRTSHTLAQRLRSAIASYHFHTNPHQTSLFGIFFPSRLFSRSFIKENRSP